MEDTLHIAIIGMACRFPGANNPNHFWRNLSEGIESITPLTDADLLAAGVDPSEFRDPNYVRMAPILDDIEHFDAPFFGYTPAEAELMDPQQRIFLECAWEALEQSGYNPEGFDGAIGVFTGSRTNSYLYNIVSNPELFKSAGIFQISVGNDLANLATRISFKLNLKGPSYGIHTACSTSLVAMHLARQSLLMDECQIALAGGVAINVPHKTGYLYQEGGILSPDGHCRAFDASAGGTIFGSGAGVVVLKRLTDALADGDTIYAVIRGTATNNDGSVKASFTAPSIEGQMDVILDALAEAELRPDDISYVETHGTGTSMGDPIEIRALSRAFRGRSQQAGKCLIGSVKTNIGHLDAAAGISSLMKTVLALQNKQLPPSLHYASPNPRIDFAKSPFAVNTQLIPWESRGPRRAGVSSFGFGGTNAHIILEEAPASTPSDPARPWQLLPLSAQTPSALTTMTSNLVQHLNEQPTINLADVAYTLQVGRRSFGQRGFVVCHDHADALTALQEPGTPRIVTGAPETEQRPVVFMFSGQGAQYVGMGRELYDGEPVFREWIDRCAELLIPHLGLDLRTLLYGDESDSTLLEQTQVAQPALFAVEYALAQLWHSWGIRPQAMIGHSIGEYVAATLAGVFSLEDALTLVAARGCLMQQLPAGAMLAVPLPKEDVYPLLDQELSLAAINSPAHCVVAGPIAAIDALEQRLLSQEVQCRRLHTSHAFHSTMMEPMLESFAEHLKHVMFQEPQIPFISNLTGTWITDAEATDPRYWQQHIRQPVRFADGLHTLLQTPNQVLLEIGPGSTLSTFARQQPAASVIVNSLRHPNDQRTDRALLLTALGQLWLAGVSIDWAALWSEERRRRMPLPTYPFERQRYWIESALALPTAVDRTSSSLQKQPFDQWFYRPIWQPATRLEQPDLDGNRAASWLIFSDACGVGQHLAETLRRSGQRATIVQPGVTFSAIDEQTYAIDPAQPTDYQRLFSTLESPHQNVLYLWTVTADAQDGNPSWRDEVQQRSFYSLLYLAQALTKHAGTDERRLLVVSNQLQNVRGDEPLCPEKATLLGPFLVIAQEHPNILCRSIDLLLTEDATQQAALSEQLIAECFDQSEQNLVAYRDDQRWVLHYESAELEPAATPIARLRRGGVYLITGGLGNIGLILAEELAQAAQPTLILTSRSGLLERDAWPTWLETHGEDDPTSRKIRQIQAIEERGAQVIVAQADAADVTQMRVVVDQALQRFGTIHGAIHAAGSLDESSFKALQELTPADCEVHFRPKVRGLQVLADALRDVPLDFCCLLSSLSSILGGLGYAAYTAANSYLDAFAHREQRAGQTTWISIDWDSWHYRWSEEHATAFGRTLGELSITPPEGVEAFRRILSAEVAPQLIVSTGDLQSRIDQWINLRALRIPSAAGAEQAVRPVLAETSRGELERKLAAIWRRVLGISRVGPNDNFFDLGGNSLIGMHLLAELRRELNVQVSPVTLFEAPSVSALAQILMPEETVITSGTSLTPSAPQIEQQAIAIVGMVGRFPGANTLEAFWENLCAGHESVTFFSDEELIAAGVAPEQVRNPRYVKARPILADIDLFDAAFFGYSPREAELMDPQQRVFLEVAWEALEHAGYDSERYNGAIGVYAGASMSTYLLNLYSNADLTDAIDPLQIVIGNDKDSLTTSVSYKLNLRGPSMAVQTFCSTSLVAVHLACQSLLRGESDMALAGGVSIVVPQASGYLHQEGGIFSPDGHSRTFDAQAQGTLFGNGVGVVVLKRLDDALRDNDRIYAVVKGSAINNDGSLKVGYTAPSVNGQAAVIMAAQAAAGVTPETIGYIEAHGTATALGDPIEIAALTKAFRAGTDNTAFCPIGSVKTNVGHLDRAAGVAALIKTVFALQQGVIPPSLHFESPNPKIDFASSPFYANTMLTPWQPTGTPRRAGVSALGFGGTNAHVIVEEAPPLPETTPGRARQLVLLSAKTETALQQMALNLATHLKQHPELELADMAYTLQVGRRIFPQRMALVCARQDEAIQLLEQHEPARLITAFQEGSDRPAAFMFSGQGTQYVGMGRELYDGEPVFREWIDRCAELLQPQLTLDLRDLLYDASADGALLGQTQYAQPALFAVEYALAQLWHSWGIRPQAMIGHSIGEYVAATLAGVFSLEDALTLVAARGCLMQQLPVGAMLAVPLPEADVLALLDDTLDLAAVNGPSRCVVAGPPEAIAALEQRLAAQNLSGRRLHTSHAFHSAAVEAIGPAFGEQLRTIALQAPRIPYLSNVSGTWITAEEATDPMYWVRHLRQTVRFGAGLHELLQDSDTILLEVGPGITLSTLARQQPQRAAEQIVIASMRHPQDQQPDDAVLLSALAQLWLAGSTIDWTGFYADQRRRRMPLPTYPFERQRYWIASDPRALSAERARRAPSTARGLYLPSWKRAQPLAPMRATSAQRRWLVLTDDSGIGAALIEQLRQLGHTVTIARPGNACDQLSDSEYTLAPGDGESVARLLDELSRHDALPDTVIHLWSIGSATPSPLDLTSYQEAQSVGFQTLLALAQAFAARHAGSLQIWAVTAGLHDIDGSETLRPEHAPLLGVCYTLPQLHPGISCRNIDVTLNRVGLAQIVQQILAEVDAASEGAVVAYRGKHRWVPTIEAADPVSLVREDQTIPALRHAGVYLATEGLTQPAFGVIRHMAAATQLRLVLADSSALPPRADWARWLSTDVTALTLADLVQGQDVLAERWAATSAINLDQTALDRMADDVERSQAAERFPDGLEAASDRLAASYICDYLRTHGVAIAAGAVYDRRQLKAQLRIVASYAQLFDFMVTVLAAEQIAAVDATSVRFLKDEHDLPNTAALREELHTRYPASAQVFQALEHCLSHYAEVLSGEVDPISILYPGGSLEMMRGIEETQARFSNLGHCRKLLAQAVAELAGRTIRRPLRILEVGAGEGGATWEIIAALREYEVEYYFTDIGKSFVLQAQQHARQANLPVLRFGTLDITQEPTAQGYPQYSFDIVIAADVIHATPQIAATLEHLTRLLKPNGYLFILEATHAQRWAHLIWGLLDGWWQFADTDLRQHSPLLTADTWRDLLMRQSFSQVLSAPTAADDPGAYYVLLRAQQPQVIETPAFFEWVAPNAQAGYQAVQTRIRRAQELEALGAELSFATIDPADQPALQLVVEQAEQRFGALAGVIHTTALNTDNPNLAAAELFALDRLFAHRQLDLALVLIAPERPTDAAALVAAAAAQSFVAQYVVARVHMSGPDWTTIVWSSDAADQSLPDALYEQIFALRHLSNLMVAAQPLAAPAQLWNRPELLATAASASDALTTRHVRPDLHTQYVAPRDDMEQRIAQLWEATLGVAQVGVHDSFFDFGGDSLQATQFVSRLREAFQVDLSLQTFFAAPTIAGLAQAITQLQTQQEDRDIQDIMAMLDHLSEEEVLAELARRSQMLDSLPS